MPLVTAAAFELGASVIWAAVVLNSVVIEALTAHQHPRWYGLAGALAATAVDWVVSTVVPSMILC